jgi:hypothetical protein
MRNNVNDCMFYFDGDNYDVNKARNKKWKCLLYSMQNLPKKFATKNCMFEAIFGIIKNHIKFENKEFRH